MEVASLQAASEIILISDRLTFLSGLLWTSMFLEAVIYLKKNDCGLVLQLKHVHCEHSLQDV